MSTKRTLNLVMIYLIFLCAQLFGLVVSHNILQRKARRSLPQGKCVHAQALVCSGMSAENTDTASVFITLLRSSYWLLSVQHGVDRDLQKQPLSRTNEMQLQKLRESVAVVIFVDENVDPTKGMVASSIEHAIQEDQLVFVVTNAANREPVQRKLNKAHNSRLPNTLHVVSSGNSIGELVRATETVVRHVDLLVDQQKQVMGSIASTLQHEIVPGQQQPDTAISRKLLTSNGVVPQAWIDRSQQHKSGRRPSVVGELVAAVWQRDRHFGFRLAVTLLLIYGMVFTILFTGKAPEGDSYGASDFC